ncbi:MAG: hypothetical protein FK733_17425, partial [Asgard group archaeon]|nr:hypothetical protein [Asgard group archaeon]
MEELGILDSLKKIIRKNKALSKGMIALIVIGIIVIVSTSTFVAIYFTILKKEEPLRKTTFYISLTATSVIDNNKDSRFDELTFNLNNNYSGTLELYDTKLYLATIGDISNSTLWEPYLNWHLVSLGNITINPLENKEISLIAGDQLNLTAFEDYYCHLEFSNSTSAGVNQLTTNWFLINDYVSLTDLLPDYLSFNLDSYMDVYHDIPGTVENYQTSGGDYALVGDAINYLPVINETENIPFYYSGNFVIFQSPLGNLSALPISQEIIDPTSDRVRRIFLLGLA